MKKIDMRYLALMVGTIVAGTGQRKDKASSLYKLPALRR
jgi:hypothetical protein